MADMLLMPLFESISTFKKSPFEKGGFRGCPTTTFPSPGGRGKRGGNTPTLMLPRPRLRAGSSTRGGDYCVSGWELARRNYITYKQIASGHSHC